MSPISPENRKLYPKNWKQIRAEILERAGRGGHPCCERCGAPNYVIGHRPNPMIYPDGFYPANSEAVRIGSRVFGPDVFGKPIKIILTIAHLNHNPRDNRRRNLAALCQRCHNRHDAEHRKKSRAKTLAKKRRER